jgi:hypothetical protein
MMQMVIQLDTSYMAVNIYFLAVIKIKHKEIDGKFVEIASFEVYVILTSLWSGPKCPVTFGRVLYNTLTKVSAHLSDRAIPFKYPRNGQKIQCQNFCLYIY